MAAAEVLCVCVCAALRRERVCLCVWQQPLVATLGSATAGKGGYLSGALSDIDIYSDWSPLE